MSPLLGSDAYRLVRDALAARLAGVEAQQDHARATDVDGWSKPLLNAYGDPFTRW
jgi:hypothetical protein